MKYIIRLFFVLVLVAGVSVSFAQDKPKIVFDEMSHNFGAFKEEAGVQTTNFEFTNKGNVPLVLNGVRASCGCTTPKWTREPVAPGQKGSIQVSYNPKNRPGSFRKTITVQSNAETPTVTLTISGSVEQHEKTLAEQYPRQVGELRVKSNTMSFGRINIDQVKTQSIELVNDGDKPVNVDFKRVPDHVKAELSQKVVPPGGKTNLTVTYDAKKKDTYGYASDRIYLSMNGEDNYRNSISLSATIEEDFSKLTPEELANAPVVSFKESSYDFGEIKQGDKVEHEFELTNTGKSDLIIRNIRASCGCTAVTPSKKVIPAGESVPLKVVFDSRGKRGRQSKSITVITNDPKTPTTILRIASNVETES